MKHLLDHNFVIFDVETTGLSPYYGDRVVEIAAIRVEKGKMKDRLETLINPEREISYGAFQVNGISNDMVREAPLVREVLPQVSTFFSDACLVGHNIKFDLGFLKNEYRLSEQAPVEGYPALDTVKMARGLVPQLPSYSLASVASHFEIQEKQKHRAMADVEMTFEVFQKLIDIAHQKDICNFDLLVNLFGTKRLRKKHKVDKMREIKNSISENSLLNLLYVGFESGASRRKVTPIKIEGQGRDAILVGYCHLRKEERNFKVDRIVDLSID